MAAKILKMNQSLEFDSTGFKLTIKKPSDDSVWVDYEREINGHVLYGSSRENEIADELANRFKRTIEAFLESPYEKLIFTGRVSEKSE